MNQIPPIHIHPELPIKYKWSKHIEKLDTSIFPTCQTLEREWKTLKLKPLSIVKHFMYVHHNPECKYDILFIRTDKESPDIIKYTL